MSKEDIEKAQRDAEAHAEDDKKKREAIDARNGLENAIYQAKKMPDEFKDKISDEDKKTIEEAVAAAEKEVESDDKDKLEAATKSLNDAIMPIGAKMYEAASKEAESAEGENKPDEPVEGEVVDKDKEEK